MFASSSLSVIVRSALAGAATLGALFLLCWIGALAAGFRATHMFISLFSAAAPSSIDALVAGLPLSLAFGAIAGALAALFSGVFGVFAPRR